MSAPAGWHPDHLDPTRLRWWDGEQWTEHVHPPIVAEPSPAPRRRTALLLGVGGGLATLVTAATIVIPLVADLHARPSSVDTVETLREPESAPDAPAAAAIAPFDDLELDNHPSPFWEGVTLPIDAPLEEMPLDGFFGHGCAEETQEWLTAHGEEPFEARIREDGREYLRFYGGIRNSATTGGSVSIVDLRVEGAFDEQTPPRIRVHCASRGGGEGPSWPLRAEATLGDPSPAVFIEDPLIGPDAEPGTVRGAIGMPFTTNLAPGEYVELSLDLLGVDPSRDFVGEVVADVLVGGEVRRAVLHDGLLQPGNASVQGLVLYVWEGGIACVPVEPDDGGWPDDAVLTANACSPAEALERARALAPREAAR